jgi:hypothetical protein
MTNAILLLIARILICGFHAICFTLNPRNFTNHDPEGNLIRQIRSLEELWKQQQK